jgi:hypothetical protein
MSRRLARLLLGVVLLCAWSEASGAAQIAPVLGCEDLLPDAISDSRAKIATYPTLDSLSIDVEMVPAGGPPVGIHAYVSNSLSQAVSGARLALTAWEPISGSSLPITALTVNLPAARQTEVSYTWSVPADYRGKHFEVRGELSVPFPTKKTNYIVNGTFDGSGCDGWSLLENYPPTLGTSCGYGYLETYSSTYNTTHGRQAAAYQDVVGANLDALTIAFCALYRSDSGFYGEGVAYTGVQFYNAAGIYLGGTYQMRTDVAIPSDTSTQCFALVAENVWIRYEESVRSILTRLPGISPAAVNRIRIRTSAYPYCSLSYCNPSALVRLDDVYVVDDAQIISKSQKTVYASTLTAQIIGDRRLLLEQCLGTGECNLPLESLVPYASTLSIWTDMHGYLCASNVYRASGDDAAANYALLFSINTLVKSVLKVALPPPATVVAVATKAVVDLVVGTAVSCVHATMAGNGALKMRDLRATAAGAQIALRDQAARYRYISITQGKAVAMLQAGGRYSTVDTLRHSGVFVDLLPDTLSATVMVGDSIRVLESGQWLNRDALAAVEYRALAAGPLALAILYQNSAGDDRLLMYRPVLVGAGAVLRYGFPDNATSFPVDLDWTGDGVADTTLCPSDATDVQTMPLASPRLGEVSAHPNPFNPRVTVEVEVVQSGPITVEVHDIRGRRVRTLHAATLPSGISRLIWDGLGADGTPMASGVYFVVARSGEELRSRRVSLVR